MTRLLFWTAAAGLSLCAAARAQAPEPSRPAAPPIPAASELADALTRHVSEDLSVKAVVGRPVTAGSVTLIPILMIDISFGGAGLTVPTSPPPAAAKAAPKPPGAPALLAAADGFLMSGEARPLGFVVVSRQGTRFISVAPTPAK